MTSYGNKYDFCKPWIKWYIEQDIGEYDEDCRDYIGQILNIEWKSDLNTKGSMYGEVIVSDSLHKIKCILKANSHTNQRKYQQNGMLNLIDFSLKYDQIQKSMYLSVSEYDIYHRVPSLNYVYGAYTIDVNSEQELLQLLHKRQTTKYIPTETKYIKTLGQ